MSEKKMDVRLVELVKDNGKYYLHLVYRVEDDSKIEEYEVPKVEIPIDLSHVPNINYIKNKYDGERCYLNAGYHPELRVLPGETKEANHVFYTVKTIEEKRKELTIEEIEKELGYKIKIVGEK